MMREEHVMLFEHRTPAYQQFPRLVESPAEDLPLPHHLMPRRRETRTRTLVPHSFRTLGHTEGSTLRFSDDELIINFDAGYADCIVGCRLKKNLPRIYSASVNFFSMLHAVGEIYEDRGKVEKKVSSPH